MANKTSGYVQKLLDLADVKINGSRPWDLQVNNEALYSRVIKEGSLGLGEAYMDGWWDAAELDEFFFHVLSADLDQKIKGNWKLLFFILSNYLFNPQRRSRAFIIGQRI